MEAHGQMARGQVPEHRLDARAIFLAGDSEQHLAAIP
jgi:hypothetical protein